VGSPCVAPSSDNSLNLRPYPSLHPLETNITYSVQCLKKRISIRGLCNIFVQVCILSLEGYGRACFQITVALLPIC